MSKKLFVLGLDGATFDLITPWVKEGLLPNFARLMQTGAWGELRSTLHPLSPPAWTSFMTGKNPGKHGIYDFVVHKPHSYELLYTNGGMRKGATIWRLLSDAGKKVVVVNVPMTYPPEEINGINISGFDAPGLDSNFVYPARVYKQIQDALGEYILRDYAQGHNPATFLKQIHTTLNFQRKLLFYMMEHYEWDFYMMVFNALDLVQHGYWQYMDESFTSISEEDRARYGSSIKDTYVKVDGILGEVLAALPEESDFVILSDHGAGRCRKAVFMNKWLESQGLLRYYNNEKSVSPLKLAHWGIKRIFSTSRLDWLKRTFPGLRQRVKSRLVFSEIDWRNTRVYCFGRESTNLFINLKGRFPMGIVNPGQEYENLRNKVIDKLMELRDPESGEVVVDKVFKGEEVYLGDCLDSAPDLLVTWKNSEYTSWPGYSDRNHSIFESSLDHSDFNEWSSLKKGGNHRPNGIFMINGHEINTNLELFGAEIIDLAPTILFTMGVPIPSDMDGKVLTAAFKPAYIQSKCPEFCEAGTSHTTQPEAFSYTEQQAKQIEERLRNLGYI
ncbi:MAG TPA: alkaline phosphatase family protein [Candidatus Brocadiia bacterium]|nr:alkaline phosphatase family protein [Candidatus Brocadiales bacterium]